MQQLEEDYPDVKFVYMTGHLEGLGMEGSLYQANQQIRDFCVANNKILFDFADIEKYDPDAAINYQEYFADDGCYYIPPGGESANWAYDWLETNPGHELTQISEVCGGCAHSVSLNCVKKGIASWYLWARLAGWEGPATIINPLIGNKVVGIKLFPLPLKDHLNITFSEPVLCEKVEIIDLNGKVCYSRTVDYNLIDLNLSHINLPQGIYLLRITTVKTLLTYRISIIR
jgi:hypothetical protein